MRQNSAEKIFEQFTAAQAKTWRLFELADETALRRSPGFGFRPILWHLAHMAAFEEYWLLQQIGGAAPINERFQIIFDPIKTPRENSNDLPSKSEMLRYLDEVREGARRVLENFDFASEEGLRRDGYVFDLVLQHELQHQETLAYLLHLLPTENLAAPDFKLENRIQEFSKLKTAREFAAAEFTVGATWNEFVYDNELPPHEIFVPAFKLDRLLVTNEEFAEFIGEKGYERQEFWSQAGWHSKEKEAWNAPLYWKPDGAAGWRIRLLFGEFSLAETKHHPVYGVSFYEAEAYAKFRGKRLPTEFEWERAAAWIEADNTKRRYAFGNVEPTVERCNFGLHFGATTPVYQFDDGAAATGCFDLTGNLWEWTSSDFAAYPGFEPFPYEDYSQTWFDGDHKVLRGGSFATSEELLRTSFRNFFRRSFRIAFAGIRLAESVGEV